MSNPTTTPQLSNADDTLFTICQLVQTTINDAIPFTSNAIRTKEKFIFFEYGKANHQRAVSLQAGRSACKNSGTYGINYQQLLQQKLDLTKDHSRKRLTFDLTRNLVDSNHSLASTLGSYISFPQLQQLMCEEENTSDENALVSEKTALKLIQEFSINCEQAITFKVGNCQENSKLGFLKLIYYPPLGNKLLKLPALPANNIPVFLAVLPSILNDHGFLIVNPNKEFNINDPLTWRNAIILDSWAGETYKVQDALEGKCQPRYWHKILEAVGHLEVYANGYLGQAMPTSNYEKNAPDTIPFWEPQPSYLPSSENLSTLFSHLDKAAKQLSCTFNQITSNYQDQLLYAADQDYHYAIRVLAALVYNQLIQFSGTTLHLNKNITDNEKIIFLASWQTNIPHLTDWFSIQTIFKNNLGLTLGKMIKHNEIPQLEKVLENLLVKDTKFIYQLRINNLTLLEYAISLHNEAAIDLLLNKLAKSNLLSKDHTLIETLIMYNGDSYLQKLLNSETYCPYFSIEEVIAALNFALENGKINCANLVCDAINTKIQDISDIDFVEPLINTIRLNDINLFGRICSLFAIDLPNGINTLYTDQMAEIWNEAIAAGNFYALQKLCPTTSNIKELDFDFSSLLYEGIATGNYEIINYLLKIGATIDDRVYENNDTFLHEACRTNNKIIVELILNQKCIDINAINEDGDTALHIAAEQKDTEVMQLLINNGANTVLVNTDGETPLAKSIGSNHYQSVKLLLDNSQVNSEASSNIEIYLRLAVEHNALKVAKVLLATFMKPEHNNADLLNELLIYCVTNDFYPMAKLLLIYGANPEAFDDFTYHPLILAVKTVNSSMTQLLLQYGAVKYIDDAIDCIPQIKTALPAKYQTLPEFEQEEVAAQEIDAMYDCLCTYQFVIHQAQQGKTPREIFENIIEIFANKTLANTLNAVNAEIASCKEVSYQQIITWLKLQQHAGNVAYQDTTEIIKLIRVAEIVNQNQQQNTIPSTNTEKNQENYKALVKQTMFAANNSHMKQAYDKVETQSDMGTADSLPSLPSLIG
ncbi:MAG: hypothetical protein Tsb005_14690 [Gammaproteobacteria bacterium]